MGIRFACHLCGHKLNIKSDLAGRRGICPACAGRFRIPLEDAEKSLPIEQKPDSQVESPDEPPGEATEPDHEPASDKAATSEQTLPKTKTILEEDDDGTWYVRPPSGGQYGPADTALLKQWIAEGRVASSSLLWRDGWPQWRDASEALPELIDKLPSGDLPAIEPSAQQSDDSDRDRAERESPTLTGDAALGSNRRKQSNRRIHVIGVLIALIGVLIAGLVYAVSL